MSDLLRYDIFLCHGSKEKAVVGPLAQRLLEDRHHNNSQPSTLNPQALGGSDWAQLAFPGLAFPRWRKAGTFRFRDPLNKERRFMPLWLDDLLGGATWTISE
jgi:hypothetical protein